MGFVAPAGTALSLGDLSHGALRSFSASTSDELKAGLCEIATRRQAWLVSTGRAAMTLAFEAMKQIAQDPRRVEVIIPGYTCYSVPAAAERAGLRPRLCDIDPTTLSPDLDSLVGVDPGRVLAIVSANLYGLPNDLHAIETFARKHELFMLDDAAQALGANFQGRPAGSFGDVGLFSFDKGKNITTLQGGALVASSEVFCDSIDAVSGTVPPAALTDSLTTIIKLPAYAALLRPALYAAVRRLPLGLGLTPYETDYPITKFSRMLTGLASHQLERLKSINGTRIANFRLLQRHLTGIPGMTMVREVSGAESVYVRCPLLVDPVRRATLISALERAGIGATASYPKALIDVPEVTKRLAKDQRPTPGARTVAERIVTLPTHGHSPGDLGSRVATVALSVLGAGPATAGA